MPNDDNQTPPPPTPKAAALSYDQETNAAPKLTAKGKGQIAEKILEIAKEHNIPIHQDADLITLLEQVELEHEIPIELYAVVAEVFSYIYSHSKKPTPTAL